MPKASHAAEVAARLEVVRRLIDAGKKRRLSPSRLCASGVALAERWLRGDAVAFEDLKKVNAGASAECDRASSRSGTQAAFAAQLASAMTNLSCFVLQIPGWKGASRFVVDDLADAFRVLGQPVSSDELAATVTKRAAKLDTPALKGLKPPPSVDQLKKGKPRKLRAPSGDAVAKRLQRAGAMVDPTLRGKSVVAWPAVVAFDERWGGTIFAGDGADEWNVLLGTFGCKKYKTPRSQGRVPIARGPGDEVYYADASGAIFTDAGETYAPDVDRMVARLVRETT